VFLLETNLISVIAVGTEEGQSTQKVVVVEGVVDHAARTGIRGQKARELVIGVLGIPKTTMIKKRRKIKREKKTIMLKKMRVLLLNLPAMKLLLLKMQKSRWMYLFLMKVRL